MKRNCNRCIALVNGKCALGHKIEIANQWNGKAISYRPLEKCTKPKTERKFISEYYKLEERK